MGRFIYSYADDIFQLGGEFKNVVVAQEAARCVMFAKKGIKRAKWQNLRVKGTYYGISPDRRLKHPAIIEIIHVITY